MELLIYKEMQAKICFSKSFFDRCILKIKTNKGENAKNSFA